MKLIRAWQVLWLAGLAFLMAMGLAGVILIYDRPELVAVPQFADLMADLGLPLSVLTTTAHLIPMLVSTALAVAVFRGKRHDPVALGFGWGLVGTFVYAAGAPRAVAAAFPRLAAAATLAEVAAILLLLVMVYVFPDGRFRPRWTRWLALAVVVALVAVPQGPGEARLYMIDPRQPRWAAATFAVLLAVWILTAVPAQMIRYRRYADMVQRQQVRWILVGFASLLVPTPVVGLLVVLRAPTWLVGGALLLLAVVSLVLPITTGIALFRYRLFELDRIVTRTFTYAVVTGVLLAVYAGLVFLLRQLLPVEGDLAVRHMSRCGCVTRQTGSRLAHPGSLPSVMAVRGDMQRLDPQVGGQALQGAADRSAVIPLEQRPGHRRQHVHPSFGGRNLPQIAAVRDPVVLHQTPGSPARDIPLGDDVQAPRGVPALGRQLHADHVPAGRTHDQRYRAAEPIRATLVSHRERAHLWPVRRPTLQMGQRLEHGLLGGRDGEGGQEAVRGHGSCPF